ncbi:MAG: tetratricopeptide repeat protein [Planctomycetes bacterium]|nr:tetratricopeptide repeat protein [Planctomycetota bacterium]
MFTVHLALAPFFLLATPPDKTPPVASWAGKTVLIKQIGSRLVQLDDKGAPTKSVPLTSLEYRVLADRNDRIQLRTNQGITGWVSKSEVVLLDDAVAFFSKRIQQNANDADAYGRRAWSWKLKGENDAAIKDFSEALRLRPTAANYSNRAIAYHAKKEYDKALDDYSQALRLSPQFIGVYNNRGILWAAKKDYLRAIEDYSAAIRLDPKFLIAYRNRGLAYNARRDYDRAIADFTRALELDPNSALSRRERGKSWAGKKEYDKALTDFNEAIRLDPKAPASYWARALFWNSKKDDDKAIADFTETIRLSRSFAPAYTERGMALGRKKKYESALADFNKALEIDGKSASAHNAVAWFLATCPEEKWRDGKRAVDLATKAVNLSRRNPIFVDTLAAALAETGNFADAAQLQEEVLRDARWKNDPAARARLELYRKKLPYRQAN